MFAWDKISPENVVNTHATGAAGAATTITLAADAAGIYNRKMLGYVSWSYDAAPAAGSKITITVGGVTKLEVSITAAGPGGYPLNIFVPANTAAVVTLSGPGGAVVGKVNLEHGIL